MNDFRFPPDGARARALDLRMRRTLAQSLAHITERAQGHVRFQAQALDRLIQTLEAGARLPPATFGLYTDLVGALTEDRLADAEALLDALAQARASPQPTWIRSLGDPALATHKARYQRLMGCSPEADFFIEAPAAEHIARFEQELPRALALMRAATPSLAEEFDALVSELVMVSGGPRTDVLFDGGSCYMLWGALFLNVDLERSPVALLEVLAHESAHMLLYAFAADEPLVLNEDDERYPSPLRVDQRPMDGIYHATYVSARMHWAMGRLLDTDLLDPVGRQEAQAAHAADARNFAAGDTVVRAHGRLTATGEALMSEARGWMNGQR